jgi:hypothetical protein
MDYYAVGEGLLAEEFVLAGDHTATGVEAAAWSPEAGWTGGARVSRALRQSPAQARPLTRGAAVELWPGLPTEEALRLLADRYELPVAAPLRLGPGGVYRVLCAGELTAQGLTALLEAWPMTLTGDLLGVIATGGREGLATWELRRIGAGLAWSADVRAVDEQVIGPLLRELRQALRMRGLIPVTVERF